MDQERGWNEWIYPLCSSGGRGGWDFSAFQVIQDFLGITLFLRLFFFRLISGVKYLFPKIPHHPIPPKIPTSGLAALWELWDNCGMWEQPPNPAPK